MTFLKLKQIIILGLLATSTSTPSLHSISPSSTPTATSSSTTTTALLQGANDSSIEINPQASFFSDVWAAKEDFRLNNNNIFLLI